MSTKIQLDVGVFLLPGIPSFRADREKPEEVPR
jgi:hypothetical protein